MCFVGLIVQQPEQFLI